MSKIRFTVTPPMCDRVHYVNEKDIKIVLSRLSPEVYTSLNEVHFNDQSEGGHTTGYTNHNGKEIAICALSPRTSLSALLIRSGSPKQYGAERGKQWPKIAVRRFLLYNTFLHELGHLQVIHPTAKSSRRKFGGERKADEFSKYWRKRLWTYHFDHPDPAHNPPTDEELSLLVRT